MSIINDHTQVNRAMQALQPVKAVRSNGFPICHKCYCYLGEQSVGTVLNCPGCSSVNRVEE